MRRPGGKDNRKSEEISYRCTEDFAGAGNPKRSERPSCSLQLTGEVTDPLIIHPSLATVEAVSAQV